MKMKNPYRRQVVRDFSFPFIPFDLFPPWPGIITKTKKKMHENHATRRAAKGSKPVDYKPVKK